MEAYHIHIEGIVQGVGFRPFVYKLAVKHNLTGWVNNSADGVHIHINTTQQKADIFLNKLLKNLPTLAVVTGYRMEKTGHQSLNGFEIIASESNTQPRLLLTPDVAVCEDCRKELYDKNNRRYKYPFTTCTNCGPRYSIIEKLPYDRPNTTMKSFKMCLACWKEYNNPLERRHFSQTNSCLYCSVEMQLFEKGTVKDQFVDLEYIVKQWQKGKIIAVKGIGGYLLTCDAYNINAVNTLRKRKKRPHKPFALMYPTTEAIEKDCFVSNDEKKELTEKHSPILLLTLKNTDFEPVFKKINDGLNRLGVMLPYTPLYEILLHYFGKPIIATSGNITDSSIIYEDEKAIDQLSQIADLILMNNRDIVIPQDDGVEQYSKIYRQKIIMRRSRGKAPVYINPELRYPKNTVFTAGSMLKSVFGLLNKEYVYMSQYLGNTENYESQETYEKTFAHFEKMFSPQIDTVVLDKHPGYFSTQFGKLIAKKYNAEILEVQHHKAHFYSVLGENNLLRSKEKILGIIWDGTGLGDDGNIWGGEFFIYNNKTMSRVAHLNEFDLILTDKMVKEPRISALSIGKNIPEIQELLKHKFSETEWKIYQKLLFKNNNLKSTSMGRFFDAAASIIFDYDYHRYDSQASMKFENQASQYYYENTTGLNDSYLCHTLPSNFTEFVLKHVIKDIKSGINRQKIAVRFHLTLAHYIIKTAEKFNVKKLAFSGGVFQNGLMADIIIKFLNNDFDLYFHREFSPNDEGIPFGQLMYFVDNHQKL